MPPDSATTNEVRPRATADLVLGFTVLLLCQLVGDITSRIDGLPVPGPVIGMLVLLFVLGARGDQPAIVAASDRLLAHLSLLFVPAGVGATQYLGLLARDWLPIAVALLACTPLTILVTAAVMRALTAPGEGNAG